jgi:hypothetical protein
MHFAACGRRIENSEGGGWRRVLCLRWWKAEFADEAVHDWPPDVGAVQAVPSLTPWLPDHVHMLISTSPKDWMAEVVNIRKRRGVIRIAQTRHATETLFKTALIAEGRLVLTVGRRLNRHESTQRSHSIGLIAVSRPGKTSKSHSPRTPVCCK